MPKSNRLKLAKCHNLKVWQFGFRHVLISDVRASKFQRNLSKNWTFHFQLFGPKPNDFGPNCLKSEQFMSVIWTSKSFCLGLKSSKQTVCLKSEKFCPIFPITRSDFKHLKMSEIRTLKNTLEVFLYHAVSHTNTAPLVSSIICICFFWLYSESLKSGCSKIQKMRKSGQIQLLEI